MLRQIPGPDMIIICPQLRALVMSDLSLARGHQRGLSGADGPLARKQVHLLTKALVQDLPITISWVFYNPFFLLGVLGSALLQSHLLSPLETN